MKNKLKAPAIVMMVTFAIIAILAGSGIFLIVKGIAGENKNTDKDKATYAIHYEANGGTGVMNDQIIELGKATALSSNSFSRLECSFAGWNTRPDGSGINFTDKASIKDITVAGGKATLYAQWVSQSYTVHFEPNGGKGTMNDQAVDRGSSVKLTANTFSRADYDFTGWNTKSDGTGKHYADSASVKDIGAADETVTLFAQWKIRTYTISFYSNGGAGSMNDQVAERGSAVKLNANTFKRDNYMFAGWNTKQDGTGTNYADRTLVKDIAVAGGKITLYAQWKLQTYIIRYDANGGSGKMDDQTLNRGEASSLSENKFSRDDFDFTGWNTKSDGTGKSYSDKEHVKDLASAGENVTLYAQWSSMTYKIRYDANGGSGAMNDQSVARGASVKLAANLFSRENYYFTGWNTREDGSGDNYAADASVKNLASAGETVTLYAQWKIQTYTIHYDANGGSGTMEDQTMNRGESETLKPNGFTREDHYFTGWNTKPDGTGVSYDNEAEVSNLAASGVTATLYAQWKKETYTVRYDANGGSGTMEDQIVERGASGKICANAFVRDEYEFIGWNTKPDRSGVAYEAGTAFKNLADADETVTLYAQWLAKTYVIHFDANGGTGVMDDQPAVRGFSTKLSKLVFACQDKYFTGWNTKPDGSGIAIEPSGYVINPAPLADEITLYAQWNDTYSHYRVNINSNGGRRMSGAGIDDEGKWIDINVYGTIEPNVFERDGYRFTGWNTKPDGSGVPYDDEELVINLAGSDMVYELYAQWECIGRVKK